MQITHLTSRTGLFYSKLQTYLAFLDLRIITGYKIKNDVIVYYIHSALLSPCFFFFHYCNFYCFSACNKLCQVLLTSKSTRLSFLLILKNEAGSCIFFHISKAEINTTSDYLMINRRSNRAKIYKE